MLWRLDERGVDVGNRWTELAGISATRIHGHGLIFPDMHFMLALEAAGDTSGRRRIAALAGGSSVVQPGVTQSRVIDNVGLALAKAISPPGIAATTTASWSICCRCATRCPPLGGSHAQRDLFHQILIAATLRAPRPALARALLGERTRLKPENAWSWQRYAEALKATGDDGAARAASDQARALLTA